MRASKFPIQFTCTANELEALEYYAQSELRSVAGTVSAIVRRHLIVSPTQYVGIGFNPDQSFLGWIQMHRRFASGDLSADPGERMEFAACPVPCLSAAKRSVRVRASLDFECREGLRYLADRCWKSPSAVVRHIVRTQLIEAPLGLEEAPSFPSWQQLSLWVRANIQRAEDGGPQVSRWERFGLSADGSRVVRFDFVTAGDRQETSDGPQLRRIQRSRWRRDSS